MTTDSQPKRATTVSTESIAPRESAGGTLCDARDDAPRIRPLVELGVAVVLAVVTAGVYARILTADFVDYDDFLYVVRNDTVQQGLTWGNLRWAMVTPVAGNWHPLTMISHMLDCQLFGLNAAGHHATNLLLHVANTVLLFWVLTRMTGQLWPAALVAALFAWHPLHVESVAWVAERKDVLSTLFWFLTLAAYWHYARRPAWWRYLLVAGLLTMGLMSKPMLVTVPALLLLLDFWPLRRFAGWTRHAAADQRWPDAGQAQADQVRMPGRSAAWLIAEKLPLLGIAVVFSLITLRVQRIAGAVQPLDANPLARRIANAMISYTDYIGQTLWPAALAPFYPHPMGRLSLAKAIVSGLALVLITVVVIARAGRRGFLAVGWLWFLGTLVPVIGIVQAGGQARADRYTYVPLVGLFIVAAWGAVWWAGDDRRRRVAASLLAAGCLVALLPITWRQVGYWHDTVTLFRHANDVTKDNYVADYGVGTGLVGRFDRQEEETGQGDPELLRQAIESFEHAVALRPKYDTAEYAWGGVLKRLERYDEAATHFQACLKIGLEDEDVHTHLGECYDKLGQLDQAQQQYERALDISLDAYAARHRLIDVLLRKGLVEQAIKVCRAGLQHQPNDPRVADRLARIYATSSDSRWRDARQAVVWAEKACRLTQSRNPQMLDTLGTAYAAAGRFAEAIEAARRAMDRIIELRARYQEGEKRETLDRMAREIDARIDLYRRGRPAREVPIQWTRQPITT